MASWKIQCRLCSDFLKEGEMNTHLFKKHKPLDFYVLVPALDWEVEKKAKPAKEEVEEEEEEEEYEEE